MRDRDLTSEAASDLSLAAFSASLRINSDWEKNYSGRAVLYREIFRKAIEFVFIRFVSDCHY